MNAAFSLLLAVALAAPTLTCQAASPAKQGSPILSRIHARGAVACGAVERPGLAENDGQGHWRGLEVDICRAIATAVLGSPERIVFSDYGSPAEFDRVRKNEDDVSFLSGGELIKHKLAGVVVPGPTVFIDEVAVMVPGDSSAKSVPDLAGQGICFMIAETAESSLSEFFETQPQTFLRHPYSETGEMEDAYAVRRCQAMAAESVDLAKTRTLRAQAALHSRLLPQPLSSFPIVATTGLSDAKWTATVAWVVNTLIVAERPERKWFAGGARAMPVGAAALGLSDGWQARVIGATGHYGDIFARNLGSGSGYGLERGPNANQLAGGALIAPFAE